jgi:hypothetical protein
MFIAQYFPQWLRSGSRKPAPLKATTLNKKDRQVLPTLPNAKRPSILFRDDRSPGHQLRGLT